MVYVCKLDKDLYRCLSGDITTEDVIITEERIDHIRQRHPNDYETVSPFFRAAIENPDYILEDTANTGLILKHIESDNFRIKIVLRVHTSNDPADFKNSILSAWMISDRRWRNYVNNKTILYKRG